MRRDLPQLTNLIVIGGEGEFRSRLLRDDTPRSAAPASAPTMLLLMYTSGTTGEPKG
jgi:long-subunit acyl-CoA synthetase (AMP-forming)